MNEEQQQKHTLVSVTKGFISMLMNSNGSEVDLVNAESTLGASKRRLYDVTNVLAGIGLIERCGKAKVKWVGDNNLIETLNNLNLNTDKEEEIDKMIQNVDNYLNDLGASDLFNQYAWITPEDVLDMIPNDDDVKLFVLQGPNTMTIQLNDNEGERPYQLICKAPEGDIDLIPISRF